MDGGPADRPFRARRSERPGDALFPPAHDVELLEECGGCLAGTVVASRRVAGTRRIELEIGGHRERVEIEIPVEHKATLKSRVAFRPKRWKVFRRGEVVAPRINRPAAIQASGLRRAL